jgi:hypothetical protein
MSLDREGRRNSAKDDEGGSNREVIEFLRSKLDPDDLAEAIMMLNGGVDPQDPAMDAGGRKIGADEMRRLIADARSASYAKFEEHRKSLGLRRIRNLG